MFDNCIRFMVQGFVILVLGQVNSLGNAKNEGNRTLLGIEPKPGEDWSGNLVLTPLIESGQIKKAQKLARVQDLAGASGVQSYSGFFTVNPLYNSNMFFWFFPAQLNPETAPLLIWLQGGPGTPSAFGLFVENGPFYIDEKQHLQLRKDYAWTLTHSIIYFDNPVGTGFSYTGAPAGYARTLADVSRDLYNALSQFYKLFPNYTSRDLYLTGESFAGHYCPDLAFKIHNENKNPSQPRINLRGIIVGNGMFDPYNIIPHYDEVYYNFGLIDDNERRHFEFREELIRKYIRSRRWVEAKDELNRLVGGYRSPYLTYFTRVSGYTNYFNLLVSSSKSQPELSYYKQFVQKTSFRRAIHVGNQAYGDPDPEVLLILTPEILKSTSKKIEKLLDAPEKYQITFYTGQLDLIVPETSARHMIQHLKWSGRGEYLRKKKLIWRSEDGTEILGYVKSVKNLNVLMIRNAGHLAAFDQPAWIFRMINILTSGNQFV